MKLELYSEKETIDFFQSKESYLLEKHYESVDISVNQILIKRIFDIIVSLLIISLVSIWLFPLICLIISVETKGNPFYKQARRGLNNKIFYCWKFRTMKTNIVSIYRATTPNDKRITKVGKILRKTNLDEIPQILNVLLGDMSLVGPRPLPIEECIAYETYIPNFNNRHLVKPGITGLAQINGLRGNVVDFEDNRKRIINRTKYDLFYIKNLSVSLDFKIIFLTFMNTLLGEDIH